MTESFHLQFSHFKARHLSCNLHATFFYIWNQERVTDYNDD